MQATEDAGGSAPLRRNRDFRLLLTGSSVSMLGSRVSAIAYPLLVLALTGSPVVAGWACFATIAPSILVYLPVGALVDRWDPRRAMLLSELGRATAIATIVVALALRGMSVAERVIELVIAGAVGQILEVFSVLAERRLICSVVEPAQTTSALARSEARAHLVILIGRPLGALLFSLGRIVPFATDLLSFSVSIGALKRVRNDKERRASQPQRAMSRHLAKEIGEGFLWLRRNPFAGVALPLTGGTTLIVQALIMVFLAEAHVRHLAPVMIGLVLAASGAGGALGAVAGPWLFVRFGYSLLKIQMCAWFATLTLLALSGGRSFPGIALTMAILGMTGALGNIAVDTFVIRNAAETILARVMSVDRVTSFGAVALGPLLGGIMVHRYGAQYAIWMLLVMTALLLVAAAATPSPPDDHYLGAGGPPAPVEAQTVSSSARHRRNWAVAPHPKRGASCTPHAGMLYRGAGRDRQQRREMRKPQSQQPPQAVRSRIQRVTRLRRPIPWPASACGTERRGLREACVSFFLAFFHPCYLALLVCCRVTAEVPSAGHELQTELPDVTGVGLAGFELLDDSVLANCLRRFRAEAESPGDTLAGFSNSL